MRDSDDKPAGASVLRHRRLMLGVTAGLCVLGLAGGGGLLLRGSDEPDRIGAETVPSASAAASTSAGPSVPVIASAPVPSSASPSPSEAAPTSANPSASASATPPARTGAATAKPSTGKPRTSPPPPRPSVTLPVPPTSCPAGQLASWDGCHPLPPPVSLPYPSVWPS
ncbi:hypothetical protein OG871_06875 [Kitasatospora sp. NBC_00374]|uniref:hypothetical protein n=1 Tax=Kitasatospora sp. NBC_00374 TaxID=2975964 RepID=UPI0030DF4C23